MSAVARLVTFVEADDQGDGTTISVSARHVAELVDGSRVVLLDDRGWAESGGWTTASAAQMRETARVVVGPDEPPDGRSYDAEAAAHWADLRRVAQRHGIVVDAAELARLPHDVVLSDRVLARIGDDQDTAGPG
ncbi:hypothetical protein [Saccharopolyspora cebuensis]|uniref:Uncharacterized protein n=1 Tax=Saccharopolyspora cebuensis TaxID=418759 RepID=A0ABV4CDU4_9PSEU